MNKLLICTQEMNSQSSTLAFFVRWVTKLAPHYDHITVICLYQGNYSLPANVTVLSLGKENHVADAPLGFVQKSLLRLQYIARFYYYILKEHRNYNKVFIHMNDEYGVLGGLWWRLFGKKMYLWRNHYAGHRSTRWVGALCEKVFYTSAFSYTAKKEYFPQGVQMPVGVDVESLETDEVFTVPPRSLLFLARLDPSKKPEIVLDALALLKDRGCAYTMDFVGGTSKDKWPHYEAEVKAYKEKLGLGAPVQFIGAVPSTDTYKYYLSHEVYINVSQSGMLDKTIFKALAAGCIPITSSVDFNAMIKPATNDRLLVKENDAVSLADTITYVLSLPDTEKKNLVREMQALVIGKHSLDVLAKKISELV